MRGFAQATVLGLVQAAPELLTDGDDVLAVFDLYAPTAYQTRPSIFRVIVRGSAAEAACRHISRGDAVFCAGRLEPGDAGPKIVITEYSIVARNRQMSRQARPGSRGIGSPPTPTDEGEQTP